MKMKSILMIIGCYQILFVATISMLFTYLIDYLPFGSRRSGTLTFFIMLIPAGIVFLLMEKWKSNVKKKWNKEEEE